MIGLIKNGETLPDNTRVLGEVEWSGVVWVKIQGVLIQEYVDNWHKYKGIGTVKTPDVMIVPKDLIQLFEDEVLAELDDLAADKGKDKKHRGKAIKVKAMLGQTEPLNASSPEFDTFLTFFTILDSFDVDSIVALKQKLGV